MKVIILGASGMVGGGTLRECLRDPAVERVLSLGRRPVGVGDPKLQELLMPDLFDLTKGEAQLSRYDACFFCLGVSSAGVSEADYRRVTHDLTLSVARTLLRLNPGMTFVYVSGAGTDTTEHGRSMWARVKGRTENDLLKLGFRAAYMFRPGVIRARNGIRSRSRTYRVLYAILFPIVALMGAVAPNSLTSTDRVGRAMIHVVQRGAPGPWLGTRDINRLAE
jgi:uncharacterized protein YbjT (DUF2867 family)